MARSALAVQQIRRTGLAASYSAANALGHSITNTTGVFIHVKNGSGSSINVTVQTPGTIDGLAIADQVVAVAAGADKMIGPFLPGVYEQPGSDDVYVDFSDVTTVTVAALKV
jgi:hypothetical protein